MSVLIFYPSPCPEGIRASSAVATHTSETFLFFCFFFHPIYYLRPSVLSLLVVTQIRGHIAGCSSPLPTTVRALHFYHEKISGPSLVDSRRVVLTHARRSQQLVLFSFFLQMNSKSRHGGIRTNGPTLVVAFEGYHKSTGATVCT